MPSVSGLTQSFLTWFVWLWHQPFGPWVIIGLGITWILILALLIGMTEQPPVPKASRAPIPSGRSSFRWPWQKPGIPLMLGKVELDLQPRHGDAIHLAIGGTSGVGKSSTVLNLLHLPIGVLIIALDNTRPIATRIRELPDGIEWSNEDTCRTAWNMLVGPPALVSEQLVAGWPRSEKDTGHYRRIARMRLWDRLDQADRDGEVRSLPMLIDALMQPSDNLDPQVGRACRDWATKLAGMYRVLGASALGGPGDLDLVDSMQSGKKVLMRLNRFLNPEDAPTLGGMLLVHARRVAQECDRPFVLVVEEAGLMEQHQEHIGPLAQASRDRDVSLVIITQNLSQLPVEVRNNVSAWVSFAQEDDHEIAFASKRLRLPPRALWRESFKDQGRRWAYVRAPGVPTQLVHIQQVKPLVQPRTIERAPTREPSIQTTASSERVREVPRLDGWVAYPKALPQPRPEGRERAPAWVGYDKDMLRFWGQMKRTNQPTPLWLPERGVWWDEKGCLEWFGPLSKPKGDEKLGRPRSNIGRRSVTVYVETARAAGKELEPTLDHACDQPVCVDPEHVFACSIADNNARRTVREAFLTRAWLDRYGQIPEWWERRHLERIAR